MKKASKVQSFIIILRSFLATAITSLNILILLIFKRFNKINEKKNIIKWTNHVLKLASINYKIINPFNVKPQKGKPTIIMCNHTSLYDIPLSFKTFEKNRIRMLAKKELLKIPIVGFAMKKAGFPFIDRKHKMQAMKDLEKVMELLQQDVIIWIAPEGTRSKNGKLQKLKKGGFIIAIETKATIIPLGIRNAHKILPSGLKEIYVDCDVEMRIGKSLDASQYTLENISTLMDKTQAILQELVGSQD